MSSVIFDKKKFVLVARSNGLHNKEQHVLTENLDNINFCVWEVFVRCTKQKCFCDEWVE